MQKLSPFKANGGLEAYRNDLHGMVPYICPQCRRSRDAKITILFRFTGGGKQLYEGCDDCFLPHWDKWERNLDKLREKNRAARKRATPDIPVALSIEQPSLFSVEEAAAMVGPKKKRKKDDISHLRNW